MKIILCRAFLSAWYERGGMYPADENDKPVFVGRANLGVVSLNLPMILQKSREEGKDFYEVLDYYLEMIRSIHKRTKTYLGKLKASCNPLMFCQGGLWGGHLKPDECIAPILKSWTASFGVTALHETQMLYNGKRLTEDSTFVYEVMKYINNKVEEYKAEDGILYAIYGTPGESLCMAGETLVQTYEGNKMIKDIRPGDLVYTLNESTNKIELKPVIDAWCSKKDAQVVKVIFDNDQEIICTGNHPFAVRCIETYLDDDGNKCRREKVKYIRADELREGMRIKSNYVTLSSDGRPQCSIYYKGHKQLIHNIVAEYFYGEKPEGYVVHHINEDKCDNRKENLTYMKDSEHRIHHMNLTIGPYCYTTGSQMGENNTFYGKHHSDETKRILRESKIGKSVIAIHPDGMSEYFECLNDAEKAGYTRHYAKLACMGKNIDGPIQNYSGHYYNGLVWFYADEIDNAQEENHRVKAVLVLRDKYDVYDISVEDNHNFFVGGDDGILVHNCYTQVLQFRKKYGYIKGVSDKDYFTNSFHCAVFEDITGPEKQDYEKKFWDLFNGGKIQYVRYPVDYNLGAIKSIVTRAMDMGFYEGVNLAKCYCEDCGYEQLEMDVCPKCGSQNLTKIDRVSGYLGYTQVKGDTRMNHGKLAEIADRKSM